MISQKYQQTQIGNRAKEVKVNLASWIQQKRSHYVNNEGRHKRDIENARNITSENERRLGMFEKKVERKYLISTRIIIQASTEKR